MVKEKLLICILFLIIGMSIPIVVAASIAGNNVTTSLNQTNASEFYFITIDPIGDHAVGEVFFINGTTNLPIGESLSLEIMELYANNHTRPQFAPEYPIRHEFFDEIANIPITSNASKTLGTNEWSENVTDIFAKAENDNYSIEVFPSNDNYKKYFRDPNNPNIFNEPNFPNTFFYLTTSLNSTQDEVTSQIVIQSTSGISLKNLTVVPTTSHSAQVPSLYSIAIIGMIVIIKPIFRKKRD